MTSPEPLCDGTGIVRVGNPNPAFAFSFVPCPGCPPCRETKAARFAALCDPPEQRRDTIADVGPDIAQGLTDISAPVLTDDGRARLTTLLLELHRSREMPF